MYVGVSDTRFTRTFSSVRCTAAWCLFTIAGLVWRLGAKCLSHGHPARSFALGCSELVEPVQNATGFTRHGHPVERRKVVAWTAAVVALLSVGSMTVAHHHAGQQETPIEDVSVP